MKHTLIAVGSIKTAWIKEGCRQYLDRLSIDVLEVPASKQKDPSKQSEGESNAVLDRLGKIDGTVWVLDERGEQMSSKEFSGALEKMEDRGEKITFVLGGAYGLSEEVRSRSDRIIALSQMTFPHELCRLVFLEQLYRAQQIQKGSGYHH